MYRLAREEMLCIFATRGNWEDWTCGKIRLIRGETRRELLPLLVLPNGVLINFVTMMQRSSGLIRRNP
jgi:hypothetical protein